MRTTYLNELKSLNQTILQMGSYIEEAISNTMQALSDNDPILAQDVINKDSLINECERTIESICFKLLLTQQPVVATDLRMVSAALKMITDMERIGDFAADIAEIVIHSSAENSFEPDFIYEMSLAAKKMVDSSVLSYTNQDIDLARKVCADDDEVDDYFAKSKKLLLNKIMEDESFVDRALDLMMISKYLERIGDHSCNIAEWVIFGLTGEHKRMGKSTTVY